MRVKLGLTHDEIMKTPWISLQLQSADFPYYKYDANKSKVITDPNQIKDFFNRKKGI